MEGVELKNMGQQILGSYPVHFHLTGDVDERGGYDPPTYLDNLAIHHSFSRCIAIHGTHGLLVGIHFIIITLFLLFCILLNVGRKK